MMSVVRSGALLLVTLIGFAGLFGSSRPPEACDSEEERALSLICQEPGGVGGGGGGESTPATPAPVIPQPVVAINDRGVGLAAYIQGEAVIARRFNGTEGFEPAVTAATGAEEDLDVGIAGAQARIAWQGENGRVSVITGDEAGAFQPQIDVAASGADDPVIASDPHTTAPQTFVAWRLGTTQSNGFAETQARGSGTLLAPYPLLSRYPQEEDVSASQLFGLRVATSGPRTLAIWTATRRSDSSFVQLYASRLADSLWSDARPLGRVANGETGAVGVDVDGNALVIWAQSDGIFYSRYIAQSDSWLGPFMVHTQANAAQLQLDLAPNGRAIAAWTAPSGGVWASEYDTDSGSWIHIHQLNDATTTLNGRDPRVAIDGVGIAVVVWRGEGRAYSNEHARDSGWTPASLLGNTQSALDLDMNTDGLGVAVWWQDGLQSRIWNRAGGPTARFTIDPHPGVAGHGLLFEAQGSSGPFPISMYEWDWEDDGTFETGSVTQTHVFENAGQYTTRLRITDTAAQTATTTRTVNVAPLGELSSRVIVNYRGPGDGSLEIHSTQPGFTPVQCGTSTPPGQETDTGTCSATVLAGYDITIVAAFDPIRTIFSGWQEGRHLCRSLATSTAPGGTRAECRFNATSADRTFNDIAFTIAPPTTHILRIELHQFSLGGGSIGSNPGLVSCTVQNQLIQNSTGGVCSYSINPGDTLTLVANPTGGSAFMDWEGCDSEPAFNQCTVTMNGFRTVTARFSGG